MYLESFNDYFRLAPPCTSYVGLNLKQRNTQVETPPQKPKANEALASEPLTFAAPFQGPVPKEF